MSEATVKYAKTGNGRYEVRSNANSEDPSNTPIVGSVEKVSRPLNQGAKWRAVSTSGRTQGFAATRWEAVSYLI